MRILLLGGNGQVGFELQRSLAPLGDVVATTRSGRLPDGRPCEVADLSDPGSLPGLVARIAPDLVVNAGAYTAVDRAEDEPERRADRGDHADLDEVLHEDLLAARAERPAHARERRVVQELREQESHGIQEADREEGEGEADQDAVVVAHRLVVDQPLVGAGQPVVQRPLVAPGLLLLHRVVVEEGLEAVARRGVDRRQFRGRRRIHRR